MAEIVTLARSLTDALRTLVEKREAAWVREDFPRRVVTAIFDTRGDPERHSQHARIAVSD
jgi:hypothetical protein